MHRTIGVLSKRFVQIRPGEGKKVLLTFGFFFLIITAYYLIKPVSRSLVLEDLGPWSVPIGDLLSAMVMGPMVALFARLVDRLDKPRLVSLSFWVLTALLVVFWALLQSHSRWVAAVFYIWVAVFSVLVVTLFWLVANDLYRPREAKRLFGFIGSGGILGGIVGSSVVAAAAKRLGTSQLLLLSGAVLLVCWFVVQRLWRYAPSAGASADAHRTASPSPATFEARQTSVARLLLRSRYLLLLVALVGIAKLVSTLIEYQFNPFIAQRFPGEDAKTAFLGLFYVGLNTAAFVVQFFCTSWVLRRLGLAWALLILPLGVLAGSVGLLVVPAFWIAASTELYDRSLNYSLQQTSKEVLYLPIDRSVRYKVKPFIDMVVFRIGKGVAGIIGIIALILLDLEARFLSVVSIPVILAWLAIAIWLKRAYLLTIRAGLQRQAEAARPQDPSPRTEPAGFPFALGVRTLSASRNPEATGTRKLALARHLVERDGAIPPLGKQLVESLQRFEQSLTKPAAFEPEPSRSQLKDCLLDRSRPLALRCEAVRRLVEQAQQEAVDCLLGIVMVEEDVVMRRQLIHGLTCLRLRDDPPLEFPIPPIRRQIAQEVQRYERIVQMARLAHHPEGRADDPLRGLLRLLLEESVDQIFQLLSLLYRPEDIYLIYCQLREPHPYARADAIELLDNLMDPAMRWTIFPILDEDRFLDSAEPRTAHPRPDEETIRRLLHDAVWDHDRWLGFSAVCLAGRLQLAHLSRELAGVFADAPDSTRRTPSFLS